MRLELRLHRLVVGILALLLIAFIAVLLSLNPSPSHQHVEVIASLVIVIAVATAFVMIGMVEEVVALQFGMRHKRELLGYFLLGILSLSSGMYLAIAEHVSLQNIAVVVSPHALVFGIGEMRLAAGMRRHAGYRKGLLISGVCELMLGLSLLTAHYMSDQQVAMMLGYAAILSTLQLVPFLFYARRNPTL